MTKDFSVVVPVFNSADSLTELFTRLKAFFEGQKKSFEVIFVEDGGDDGSWEVLGKLKEHFPDLIKAIKLDRNFGQHNATMCGFGFAKGNQIVTIDDDLQHPPEEIIKLIHQAEKEQSVITYGIYSKKQHSFARNILSKSVKTSSKLFHNGAENGSSFRLIDRKIIQKVLDHQVSFVFIDEIIYWYTDKIAFVEVNHVKREHNQSGYNPMRLFMMAANLTYFYTNIPLKIMVYSGFIISFFSFITAIKFIIQKIFFNVPLGYTSVIVTILFSTSIIVFSLGVIGGYLSRIQTVQNKKPPYHISKVLD
ncbi:MAG: glycosyltransferase family 2 protein [Bacteroidales bacterium]|jgi:undecaprenyl-phosphate 4-deoxy-4-formamido-L-arabinose transferase